MALTNDPLEPLTQAMARQFAPYHLGIPSVAPPIAVALWEQSDGSPIVVGVHLPVMSVFALVALLLSKEAKDVTHADNVT